jgi:hypothetical protein
MKAKHPPIEGDPCYLKMGNDDYVFLDKEALLILLREEVCFFGSVWHPDKKMSDEGAFLAIGVFVNCNDLFYWACADAERIGHSEVEDLYRQHLADKQWGAWIWCCKHRKLQPQEPVKKDMIKAGAWTDELEALPKPAPS